MANPQPAAIQELMQLDDCTNHCIFVELARKKLDLPGRLISLHDSEQAIVRLGETGRVAPEVLLLDLKMPGKDGHEVLAWARRQAHLDGMGIVIVSGSSFEDDKRRAADLGADDYFAKPTGYDGYAVLAQRIEEFREERKLRNRWRDSGAAVAQRGLSQGGAQVGSSAMGALSTMSYPVPAQLATQIESFSGATGIARVVLDFMGSIGQMVSQGINPELAEITAVCRKYRLDVGLACGRCADQVVVSKRHKVIEELMRMEWDDPTLLKWFALSKRTLVRLRGHRANIVQMDGVNVA